MSEKFDQLKIMQEMFPNATFVDANGERVADTSKTIDHIADVSKKVSLTEQWEQRKLPNGLYYVGNANKSDFAYCKNQSFYTMESNIPNILSKGVDVLSKVPTYEQWQPFTAPYFRGLTTKDIAELAKKSIRLCKQSCEDNTTIQNLKELLGYCADILEEWDDKDREIEILLEEVDEALK